MRRAARRDANHAEVRDGLRAAGCKVLDLGAVGKGCPDLLVGFRGRLRLLEVKDGSKPPSARELTPDEQAFFREWGDGARLPVHVVRSLDDALVAIGLRAA